MPLAIRSSAFLCISLTLLAIGYGRPTSKNFSNTTTDGREQLSLNNGWKFFRSETNPDGLSYDHRPGLPSTNGTQILKPWILPSANQFINDQSKWYQRPEGNPGVDVPYVQASYDDSDWQDVTLPHDWSIAGPFYTESDPLISPGMGRLPVFGVGWYRQKLSISEDDASKSIYLDLEGSMSYTMVWLNQILVGGWPYGYNSFRLNLTPYLQPGQENQLAIRLDNPTDSSRWYNGGGIYRNVWLTKLAPTHVAYYGTQITTRNVSAQSATVDLVVQVKNTDSIDQQVELLTDIFAFDAISEASEEKVASFPSTTIQVSAGSKQAVNNTAFVSSPHLWGPGPAQHPHLYLAITNIVVDGQVVDTYKTRFGIRSVSYDSNTGLTVNGQHVLVQGTNNHHDQGAIGAAFNPRAAQRQLQLLQEVGCNALRMSHNPPAPQLLDLADQMGFVVMDEVFDTWMFNKTPADFHLIFPEWHEADLRNMLRRDRNHPSIVAWSYGNEVAEQQTNETGAALSRKLHDIVHQEDPTRLATASENSALYNQSFPRVVDIISLNYQGAGIRDTNPYSNISGIRVPPLYPEYHQAFPQKMIWSSESASALSTRGTYLFPVIDDISAPVNDTSGGNSSLGIVSAYELYSATFGSSADKVFKSLDMNPYVAGEFVWTGWDYIGEPTPYNSGRSSYSGIIDLAGFKKDRFYLYQSRWRPDLQMAHILPHWTWPDRVDEVTPVHVFSAADEAELYLNGQSQGRLKKGQYEYRFRWNDVVYQPGTLHVITYKNGQEWANDTVTTAGTAIGLELSTDRSSISADAIDLSFITVSVVDASGNVVPSADNAIAFSIDGPGRIVATDNGYPADLTAFPSTTRRAFSGLALAIVRADAGASGQLKITATSQGLSGTQTIVQVT